MSCQFNFSQPINGKIMYISCNHGHKSLNDTKAPIVTSLHELGLYFLFNDGYNILSKPAYFVRRNNILGHPVKFTGAVCDFGKPTEPTQF